MPLNEITPGLRPIHYSGRSPVKAQVIVADGDELHVSDDVAEQLLAQSAQFKDGPAPQPEPKAKPVKRRGRPPKVEPAPEPEPVAED